MKIENVELEEEVPSRLLSPYYVQELFSSSHISFSLLSSQGRFWVQVSLMLMFSLLWWMVRGWEQQSQGLEFTINSPTYYDQLQLQGERYVCFSEIVFSFSLENSPCIWKVILKSLERSRIRLVRKELYLYTQDLFHFASCGQIAWALFILGFQTTCWDPYYLIWGVFVQRFFILSGSFHPSKAQANCPSDASGNWGGSLHRRCYQGAPDRASLGVDLGGLLLSDGIIF